MKAVPCYRVCLWNGKKWVPHITRTRNLLRTLRQIRRAVRTYPGASRADVWVERRPGQHIPFPLPTHLGPVKALKLMETAS